jgi:hypothetical protein
LVEQLGAVLDAAMQALHTEETRAVPLPRREVNRTLPSTAPYRLSRLPASTSPPPDAMRTRA